MERDREDSSFKERRGGPLSRSKRSRLSCKGGAVGQNEAAGVAVAVAAAAGSTKLLLLLLVATVCMWLGRIAAGMTVLGR